MGKVSLLLVPYLASLLRKTQLQSILSGHGWMLGHPESSVCLIKVTKERRCCKRGGALWCAEMRFALKMELDAHCKWEPRSEMFEGTAGNGCKAHFHFHLNTTEATLDLLKIKRYIKNAKHGIKFSPAFFVAFKSFTGSSCSCIFRHFLGLCSCSSIHPQLPFSKVACTFTIIYPPLASILHNNVFPLRIPPLCALSTALYLFPLFLLLF